MQSKSLARELSAHFCGARADIENPEVVFTLPKAMWQYTSGLRHYPRKEALEIRIGKADVGTLFAFTIAENGFVLGSGSIVVVKDVNNKILWRYYSHPLSFVHKGKSWFCSQKTENHLCIFGLLAGSNWYEIYKAEVKLAGKGGKLLWQKVYQGQCFCRENWTIAAEQEDCKVWPPLARLFESLHFQEKLRPYVFGEQIPRKREGLKVKEEESEKSLSEVLL